MRLWTDDKPIGMTAVLIRVRQRSSTKFVRNGVSRFGSMLFRERFCCTRSEESSRKFARGTRRGALRLVCIFARCGDRQRAWQRKQRNRETRPSLGRFVRRSFKFHTFRTVRVRATSVVNQRTIQARSPISFSVSRAMRKVSHRCSAIFTERRSNTKGLTQP